MRSDIKQKTFDIVFKADTRAGKLFDVCLLIAILLSVTITILESVPAFNQRYKSFFLFLEWIFTLIFLSEYLLRIWVTPQKRKYILSFFGLIDLLSILPAFLSIIFIGAHSLIIIRAFRLLRVFRILKVTRYTKAGQLLTKAIIASRAKIGVFLFSVLLIVLLVGTLMYIVEGKEHGFNSIPQATYWAIVTLTTVGYGDLTPQTAFGQFISSIVMILGYAIIAVPTGIISVELAKSQVTNRICLSCMHEDHDSDAIYCKHCGEKL